MEERVSERACFSKCTGDGVRRKLVVASAEEMGDNCQPLPYNPFYSISEGFPLPNLVFSFKISD
jgi:hypothetical protein